MIYNSSKLPSLRFQNKSCPYSRLRFGSIYPPGYRKTRLPSHAHIWFFSKIGSLAQEHYRASQFRITHSIRSLNINSPIFLYLLYRFQLLYMYVFFSENQVFHGVPICDIMFYGIELILIVHNSVTNQTSIKYCYVHRLQTKSNSIFL